MGYASRMSKKMVEDALAAMERGQEADALALLTKLVDQGSADFVRKRLELAAVHSQTKAAADALWSRLFSDVQLTPRAPPAPPLRAQVALLPTETSRALPPNLVLHNPGPFLTAVDAEGRFRFDLDQVEIAQMFAIAGLAALARTDAPTPCKLEGHTSDAARFARALGLAEVVENRPLRSRGEPGRTVSLRRISQATEIEPAAREISALILPDDAEGKNVLKYVLVELFRNVIQHSADPLGGIVGAQRMDERQQYTEPTIQVTVADAGVGVWKSLSRHHPTLATAEEALDKSLWPHFSGAFAEGGTGTQENAGFGLFVIAELAKLTAGRLVLASRGATLLLLGDPKFGQDHRLSFERPPGVGFPGTLVSFELPIGKTTDFEQVFEVIRERARERTPKRQVNHWLRYEGRPADVPMIHVGFALEDTLRAKQYAQETFLPRLMARKPFALDFRGQDICTQSYLHALLYEPLRVAWAFQIPIFIENAGPAVRSGLAMLENYALGG